MPLLRVVPLKLLPYDNKNEFQLVIDMPEGSTLEETDGLARSLIRVNCMWSSTTGSSGKDNPMH
jgi:multidrug efflux pump subunit AcrB